MSGCICGPQKHTICICGGRACAGSNGNINATDIETMVAHLHWTTFSKFSTALIGHNLPQIRPRIQHAQLVPRRQRTGLRRIARTQPSVPSCELVVFRDKYAGAWSRSRGAQRPCLCASAFQNSEKPVQALLIGAARWHHIDTHYYRARRLQVARHK